MARRDAFGTDADAVSFDNTGTDLVSETSGEAIRELAVTVGVSASPGFSYGRSGNNSSGTWLYVTGSVPSNRSGITVLLSNAQITGVYIANENISTFDISFYEHDGDEINLTLLGTVSVVSSRSFTSTGLDVDVTTGKQLAVQISSGSARNISVGLQLKGTI